MKKLLITSSLIVAIATSVASAKNNLYVGLNGIAVDSKFNVDNDLKLDKKSLGLGANVGYKFNNNGLIIAPELFFDYLNSKKTSTSAEATTELDVNELGDTDSYNVKNYYNYKTKLNYRYGARLNIGYEFNNRFSVVANYGLAAVNYESNATVVKDYYEDDYKESDSYKKRGSKISSIYGLGAGYNLNENVTLKLNANSQTFDYELEEGYKIKNKIMTYSAGVAYNF